MLTGLPEDDLSAIDDLKEPEILFGGSRNNAMEWWLNRLIRECCLSDLTHLQKGFDPVTGSTLDGGWWQSWIAPEEVTPAINALDALLELARTHPDHIRALLGDEVYCCEPEELRALAAPSSLAGAAAEYKEAQMGNDGADVYSILTFVKAHRAVLELARSRDDGAMYLACLY
ncbi:hypothetical protein DZC73_20140 [Albitalea terrae]|uniref:Uncharacterized protein n=2 Tax=Piscinibacter terrae TaxID=2496871 RepID=A0A3N7IXA0_9BURK|nr:hypothetical protein DZC73_20140 [Albitalea terrae]